MDSRIQKALSKLDHGGWSLTVAGFARRACGIKGELTHKQRAELRELMMQSGLPHRRVTYGQVGFDVWDYEAP